MNSFIIFGGSQGIGKNITDYCAEQKALISIVGRTARTLDIVRNAWKKQGTTIHCTVGDVSNSTDVEHAFDEHYRAYNQMPTVVINAAAIQGPIGPFWTLSPEDIEQTIQINLVGACNVTQVALRVMNHSNFGSIIHFSGGGAAYARPRFAAYGIAKTGVVRLVETVAEELKARNSHIIINAIAPGGVKTRMIDAVLQSGNAAGEKALEEARHIAETGGTPKELILNLINFLSTPEHHKGLTGRLIHVREDYENFVRTWNGKYPEQAGKLRRIPLE